MDSNFPTTYFALANAYRVMGKYAESVEAFARFQELYERPQTAALARASFAAGGWQSFLRQMDCQTTRGFVTLHGSSILRTAGREGEGFRGTGVRLSKTANT